MNESFSNEGQHMWRKLFSNYILKKMTHFNLCVCYRYLPTKSNREKWALEKEIRNLILEVVKERTKVDANEKDLLQMVIEGARDSNLSQEETDRFIVDNCKNIYLAGFETTAVSATWCLMLLASNQEWQDRVRAEALSICGGGIPNIDMIRKMKQVL